MSELEVLLERGHELLRLLRQARSGDPIWADLAPRVGEDGARDEHALERQQLAWALQYSLDETSATDAAIVRALLAHEVQWKEQDPHQGIGETLEICCWLVSRACDPQDVWLLARAKTANFDTECGLDREHLFSGGVAHTLQLVRASTRPEREDVLAELLDEEGQPLITDDEFATWRDHKASAFPAQPQDEPLETWISRALALGRRAEGRALVQRWAKGRDPDADFLAAHASYLEELGDLAGAADARGVLVSHTSGAFERAGALGRATAAERQAQRWARAWAQLEHAALLHRNHRDWRELGLGRELVSEAFALAAHAPAAIAAQAFALGDEFATQTPRLPPVAVERALLAARQLQLPQRQEHYQRLLEKVRAAETLR